jgi:DUF1680 family protein
VIDKSLSRRQALYLGAAAAAAPLAGPLTGERSAQAAEASRTTLSHCLPGPPIPSSYVVTDFDLSQVTLGPGLFARHRDLMLEFARDYSADDMLYNFRVNAGLPNPPGAQPVGVWDVPGGNLRGHSAGHFMTLLAQAYAGSGDDFYKNKLDYMVTALGECQQALNAMVGQPPPPPPPVSWVTGKFGNAVQLSGTGEYAELPAGIVSALTDFTVAAWVNPKQIITWSRIFDFGTGTGTYMFLTVDAGSGPRFSITTGGYSAEQQINATSELTAGQWVHVAVTLSGNTGTLYVNGTAVATNAAMTLNPSSLGDTTNNWIGRSQFGDPDLPAMVDEFQIYNRALSQSEVQSLLTSAGGSAGGGNVAWYRFDETSGNTAADSSGNGKNATVVTTSLGAPGPSHKGYLAAYPETQYIELEQYATYPIVWAPWYTCHMIMRGLLDAYRLTGNRHALKIAMGMADWAHSRLAHLPRTQLDNMWKLYIAGEYNAMPVVLAELYAITGNQDCLTTAECFVNTYLFVDAINNQDTLDGEHANQHIPQYQGYLRIYDYAAATSYYTRDDYYTAAENFWDMVVPHRIYIDGGMAGVGEIFGARDVIAATIGQSNAEGCPLYNMLKLSRSLFFHNPDPKYMEYFERGLYGQIIARRQNTRSQTDPLVTYFLPVDPGAVREYSGNLGDCDGGTGPEDHTKFQESIYFRSVDGSALYVNLYMASTLSWAERGFTITQTTNYPADPSGAVRLKVGGNGPLNLMLRVSYWVQRGFTVSVNGVPQNLSAVPGEYVSVSRRWSDGDVVDIAMPFSLRIERTLDQAQTQAIAYGPVPMVFKSASTDYLELGFYRYFNLSGDLSSAFTPADTPMTFTTHDGYTLVPFFTDDTSPYHVYFHRDEPDVVFGSVDSGVPNVAGANGLTFLDTLWEHAPFANNQQFKAAVGNVANSWVRAGLFTQAQANAVIAAASSANLGR